MRNPVCVLSAPVCVLSMSCLRPLSYQDRMQAGRKRVQIRL